MRPTGPYHIFSSLMSSMESVSFFSHFPQKRQGGKLSLLFDYQSYYTFLYPCSFNGKEKDYESGFHYYGARYHWSEVLTSFISVDRYADKYPFISPYAYCAWNPIRLIDPSRDTVIVPDEKDRAFINTLLQKKIDGKRNPLYSKAFADKYKDLENSSHHYVFESWEHDANRNESGEFQPKSDYSTVKFTRGENPEMEIPELGASEYRVLFEETYHAWKFNKRGCVAETSTCTTEAEAWQFSAKAPGTIYRHGNHLTIMGRILNANISDIAKGLKEGFPLVEPSNGFPGKYGMNAKYSHLPLK